MSTVRELVLALPEEELREFVLEQRWYGSKSDEVVQVQAVDAFPLRDRDEPLLAVAVVETRFQTGTHELYNVPVGLRRGKGGFASVDGWSAFDALEDDELVRGVVEMIRAQERVEHDHGTLEFSTVGGWSRTSASSERCGRWAASSRTPRSCWASSSFSRSTAGSRRA
jgi:hypothetical protein